MPTGCSSGSGILPRSNTMESSQKQVANYALDLLDVDKYGLDHIDRRILLTMIEKFQGGPVGLDTLAAADL